MSSKEQSSSDSNAETLEFGGVQLLTRGTSGPSSAPALAAEGSPLRHDLVVGGRAVATMGTSGASAILSREATGSPAQHGKAAQAQSFAHAPSQSQPHASTPVNAAQPSGWGQAHGQAVRRA